MLRAEVDTRTERLRVAPSIAHGHGFLITAEMGAIVDMELDLHGVPKHCVILTLSR